ncbi:MAG TPA: flagellar assembly peptidoglycan hydrolase FlgJ [Chromatiaceae bacterium]|nr:flagellar assembly peptidoglycan hydrolase FlgJ [Chromatiaceae bacterium]
MNSHLSKAGIYNDFSGLAELKAGARKQSPEARKEVARQFEAMFIQIMLKSMRDAGSVGEGGDSDEIRFYQQMFDQQIALDLANNKGMGLAKIFEQQLGAGPEEVATDGLSLLNRKPVSVQQAVIDGAERADAAERAAPQIKWSPESPEAFIQDLWPAAQKVADKLGITPEVLIAQAALETGWGKKMPDGSQGSSMNLFGIKADASWRGEKVSVQTLEYREHVAVREQASFRAYDSTENSMEDYVAFLKNNPRYETALKHVNDPQRFLRELQDAGYATDPHYAEKIQGIMSSDRFASVVSQLKAG